MKKLLRRSMGAFTMAEILISLTIIGVIAAITLPSLRANINEKTWATQKKALLSRMSQGIAMMDAQNTYATAQEYVTEGLAEVLKINNICATDTAASLATTLADCGITGNVITMAGNSITMPITWSGLGIGATFTNDTVNPATTFEATAPQLTAAFETANGESVMVFYNPDCIPDNDDAAGSAAVNLFPYVCANIIYDLNQDKGPNTMGKDIGYMTVFYASDSVVATGIPGAQDGASCSDSERLPNLTEAVALQLNGALLPHTTLNNTSAMGIGTNTAGNSTTYHYSVSAITSAGTGTNNAINRTSTAETGALESAGSNLRCVKR